MALGSLFDALAGSLVAPTTVLEIPLILEKLSPEKKAASKFETAFLMFPNYGLSDQFTLKLRLVPLTVITTDLSQVPSP